MINIMNMENMYKAGVLFCRNLFQSIIEQQRTYNKTKKFATTKKDGCVTE